MSNIEEQTIDIKLNEYFDSFSGKKNIEEAKKAISLTEALTSVDANILLPKVVQQVVTKASEANLVATKYFKRINLTDGRSMEFVHFGAIRAFEIGEAQEYPEQTLNLTKNGVGSVSVSVRKYGLRVAITEEMISDSQWDVIGMHLEAAGRALARLKEENAFRELSTNGHVVFDAALFSEGEEGYPTGRGFDGELNGTLTAEDLLDMAVSVMSGGYTPTDIIMHPLCWSLFAKNSFIRESGAPAFGVASNPEDPRTFNTQNGLGINVEFSPNVPFDQVNKTFDFYIIDRNNIGVMLVKDDVATEQFSEPMRDIQNLKIRERYGLGVLNGGLAIAVARNIPFKRTYPAPTRSFEDMPLPSDMKGQKAKKHDEV